MTDFEHDLQQTHRVLALSVGLCELAGLVPEGTFESMPAPERLGLPDAVTHYEIMQDAGLDPDVVVYPMGLSPLGWHALLRDNALSVEYCGRRGGDSTGVDLDASIEDRLTGSYGRDIMGWGMGIVSGLDALTPQKVEDAGVHNYEHIGVATFEQYLAAQWRRLALGEAPLDAVSSSLIYMPDGDMSLLGHWDGYKQQVVIRPEIPQGLFPNLACRPSFTELVLL